MAKHRLGRVSTRPITTRGLAFTIVSTVTAKDLKVTDNGGGTPTDPSDDEFLSERRIKGSTGRTDDLCAAAVQELT